jgi:hypothetical protein
MWVFYFLQGEEGEGPANPNAYEIHGKDKVQLRDLLGSFPLRAQGKFHYRFRVNAKRAYCWADIVDPNATLPMQNGRVIVKVLRLGECGIANFDTICRPF